MESGRPSDAGGREMSAIELENVYAGYGKSEILHGVNLEIPAGKMIYTFWRIPPDSWAIGRAACSSMPS